jgi:hypothetical protein
MAKEYPLASQGGGSPRGAGKGPGGYSYRSSELTLSEKRAMTKQNKSAESMKNKDLDKYEKGVAARAAQKAAAADAAAKALKIANKKGMIKGAATTVAVGAAAKLAAAANDKKKPTPKATVKAKPMTEAQKQAKALDALQAKRAAAEKKTGSRPNYRTN